MMRSKSGIVFLPPGVIREQHRDGLFLFIHMKLLLVSTEAIKLEAAHPS